MITIAPSNRPHVLLIAEAANPEWTSVPLVGWSLARALLERVEGHIVTHLRNRQAILRAGLKEGIDFTAIDSDRIARPLGTLGAILRGGRRSGKGWTTVQALASISYYYFERLVWQAFRERIRSGEFDVVHRITPLSPTVPSTLAKKCDDCGVPFVIGPLNGGVPWPKWFQDERKEEREWLAPIRGMHRMLPGYWSTRKHSAAILVGSRDTMSDMPQRFHSKLHYIPENAIDPSRFSHPRSRTIDVPLQLLFVGRLVPYKGADMVIEAAAPLLKRGQAELTIVGDGPQREKLNQQAAALGCTGAIRFAGAIPHQKTQEYFASADLFTFPSIREFGGGVVLEAMAMGAVPIIVDYGGPSELVPIEAGYHIPIAPRPAIVDSLRAILESVAANPSALPAKSSVGRAHVYAKFTWQSKAAEVSDVYQHVMATRCAARTTVPIPLNGHAFKSTKLRKLRVEI